VFAPVRVVISLLVDKHLEAFQIKVERAPRGPMWRATYLTVINSRKEILI
jgi:hypothetical protein